MLSIVFTCILMDLQNDTLTNFITVIHMFRYFILNPDSIESLCLIMLSGLVLK